MREWSMREAQFPYAPLSQTLWAGVLQGEKATLKQPCSLQRTSNELIPLPRLDFSNHEVLDSGSGSGYAEK